MISMVRLKYVVFNVILVETAVGFHVFMWIMATAEQVFELVVGSGK
jgi:hypothetical protein